jgi:hypothetical protein
MRDWLQLSVFILSFMNLIKVKSDNAINGLNTSSNQGDNQE